MRLSRSCLKRYALNAGRNGSMVPQPDRGCPRVVVSYMYWHHAPLLDVWYDSSAKCDYFSACHVLF